MNSPSRKENAAITLLDISDNQIGLVGAGHIAKGLGK